MFQSSQGEPLIAAETESGTATVGWRRRISGGVVALETGCTAQTVPNLQTHKTLARLGWPKKLGNFSARSGRGSPPEMSFSLLATLPKRSRLVLREMGTVSGDAVTWGGILEYLINATVFKCET